MYQSYNKSCIKCNIIKACGAWELNANVHRQLLFLKQGLVMNKLIQHPNNAVALYKLFNCKLDACILNT